MPDRIAFPSHPLLPMVRQCLLGLSLVPAHMHRRYCSLKSQYSYSVIYIYIYTHISTYSELPRPTIIAKCLDLMRGKLKRLKHRGWTAISAPSPWARRQPGEGKGVYLARSIHV